MRDDEMKELEVEIGKVLRGLPGPKAPSTLLARVMHEVHSVEAVPMDRAGWFYWPMGWRIASLGLMGALLVGGVVGVPYLLESVGLSGGMIEGQLTDFLAPALGLAAFLRIGFVAISAMVGAIPPEIFGVVGVGGFLMMVMTFMAGAALRRLSPDWEMYS